MHELMNGFAEASANFMRQLFERGEVLRNAADGNTCGFFQKRVKRQKSRMDFNC
jgi:hypothetical protein